MFVEQQIIDKLTEKFQPSELYIENESHKHNSGKGSESHFKVTLVSSLFEGMRSVARHRAVYSCLAYELESGVHALALHLFTAEEWQSSGQVVPKSPNCVGVGK